MKIITDSLLIQEYQNGNELALERLIERNQSDLFNFILYKVLDESLANDIFQDTFMKIIVKLKKGEYKDEGKFVLWAKRIAHNLIIDHYRLLSKHKKVSETSYSDDEFSIFDHISEPTENIEDYLISLQINEDLMKMIQLLPDNQKEVVKLRFFDGLSFKEIAEHTDCSINTTLGRVRYAVMNLRKIMEENQIILTR
ncbi:RNA polymerase sigma factor [Riemerella anatipestifer]|uniref:RNA polymerase sigma factor n=1 Tax=Riemerella anatipestifer TaxID=34085 RepID=UPI00129ED248|nr:sigma-70 family RNA polymerase sigma factor [Riemerella anatipestifer]MBT0552396.1 sigma-70 family RNA polymerase sigma factor [Riemerella anatipestifer]MBT0554566.1 sigma-70 family RNA polymerase sigma factor [Riemerella anatipestifer]MCE3025125.1 sigma-70 family RNA polymerase sigma factor [Riemerella anatipestifer]MCU7543144.1 sigma-70 family RNA polymerase sigma factor [Riemerella anatipestifer]MCU7560769.1 sigma-70 family RNA polymerase sigma factor [Riemerella anatipestifer]